MNKVLFVLSTILIFTTLSCKKENSEASIIKNDRRDKYVGDYTVYERVGIKFQTGLIDFDTVSGVISKFVDTDSLIYPESDTSYLLFSTGDYDKPWTRGGSDFLYKLIGTDSLESDIDIYDIYLTPKIYGNNDSIVVNFLYGGGDFVYDVTQRWVKNK